MANRLMAMYNLDDTAKHNTPQKTAFRQANLIKILVGKFIYKTRKYFFTAFAFSFFLIHWPQPQISYSVIP